MAVMIGHASGTEYGDTGWNGRAKAGDQTGKEVCKRTWYSYPWIAVIRPKDPAVAERMATCCEQGCDNDNVGYDQSDRTSLFVQAKKVDFDLSKIKVKCNADCSSFMSVCANAAGIKVSKDMYTGNELETLRATGMFTIYTSSEYTSKPDKLKRGDILLGNGHTAMVLSNGSKASTTTNTTSGTSGSTPHVLSNKIKRKATITGCSFLNVREWAGKENKTVSFSPLPAGTQIGICDELKADDGSLWYFVQYNGRYGFIAARSSLTGEPYVI